MERLDRRLSRRGKPGLFLYDVLVRVGYRFDEEPLSATKQSSVQGSMSGGDLDGRVCEPLKCASPRTKPWVHASWEEI